MERRDQRSTALALLRGGEADEAVERATDMTLLRIIERRAHLATAPPDAGRPRRPSVVDNERFD